MFLWRHWIFGCQPPRRNSLLIHITAQTLRQYITHIHHLCDISRVRCSSKSWMRLEVSIGNGMVKSRHWSYIYIYRYWSADWLTDLLRLTTQADWNFNDPYQFHRFQYAYVWSYMYKHTMHVGQRVEYLMRVFDKWLWYVLYAPIWVYIYMLKYKIKANTRKTREDADWWKTCANSGYWPNIVNAVLLCHNCRDSYVVWCRICVTHC